MRSFLAVSVFMMTHLFTGFSEAKTLSGIEMMERCYRHLTGERLPLSHPFRKQAGATVQDAVASCLQTLEEVKLGASGALEQASQPIHIKVLKQFTDLHHSWFEARSIRSIDANEMNHATIDVYDAMEGGLAYSRALFAPQVPIKSVLQGNTGVEALRNVQKITHPALVGRFPRASRTYYNTGVGDPLGIFMDSAVMTVLDSKAMPAEFETPLPLIQVGELYGIKPSEKQAMSPVLWIDILNSTASSINAGNSQGLVVPHNMFENKGGGTLGTQSYLMLNFGHGFGYQANGTTKLPRKWAQSALKDFMCLKAPVLREADVASLVRTTPGAPPFRGQASCLRCHGTLDQMAMVARNIKPATVHNGFVLILKRTPLTMASFYADQGPVEGQEFWPSQDVANFNRQPPQGTLYFRNSNGELVNKSVNNFEELGNTIADQDDFYNCTAKRYFKYFTGINIELFDEGDIANADMKTALTASDRNYKKFILDLGSGLKQHQSLKKLIEAIMKSPYYQENGLGKIEGKAISK